MSVSRTAVPTGSRRRVTVLTVLVAALAGLVSPVAAALAGDAGTAGIAGAPANAEGPDDRSRFSYEVEPGQTVDDHYVVHNIGTTEQKVTVFGQDAYNTNDGAYALRDTGETPVDAGSWVTFDGASSVEMALEPDEQRVLAFSVRVPADATPGDHAAGIVVSAQSSDSGVTLDRRVATRMYVRVAGALQPALTVSSIAAGQTQDWNPFSGSTTITVTVQNVGNVALGADVTAKVSSYFGMSAGTTAQTTLDELLPGTTREVTFTVPGVPRLGYLQPEVTLQPTVSEDAMDPGTLATVSRATSIVSVPWLLLAALAAVAGLVLFARWRRARLTRQAEEWAEYTREQARREAAGDAAAAGPRSGVSPTSGAAGADVTT